MSKAIWWIIQRLYVTGLLLLVVWCTWAAFAYLYESVFVPRSAPSQYADHVLTATTSMLSPATQSEGELPQPLDHYHGLVRTPVRVTPAGCQTSGCHPLLPHQIKPETRAFTNMHVTFLDCMTCHAPESATPIDHRWVDSISKQVMGSPAMLQLIARLEKIDPAAVTTEQADEINVLLQQTLGIADEPALQEILLQLTTAEPGSPVHRHALRFLRPTLSNLARGDYGALLTPEPQIVGGRYKPVLDATKMSAVQRMDPQSSGYEQAVKDLHEPIVAKPDACISCHVPDATRIDFAKVGYSLERAKVLRSNPLADMIEQIREGDPFYLPTMLEVGDDQ